MRRCVWPDAAALINDFNRVRCYQSLDRLHVNFATVSTGLHATPLDGR